jgi:predicted RNA-binding protein YlxR (DUF448 family)
MTLIKAENRVVWQMPNSKRGPGRGVYVCHRQPCIEALAKPAKLERAFRTKISLELAQSFIAQLQKMGAN